MLTVQAQPAMRPGPEKPIEFRGEVVAVNLVPGGMPSLLVATAEKQWTVRLGSMRYLIESDFNPKKGESFVVRGIPFGRSELMAISMVNTETGRKLVLRDEEGRPVWRGGGARMVTKNP